MQKLATAFLLIIGILTSDVFAEPLDWPHWRGPEMNGISREKNLVESWDPDGGEGGNLLWKKEGLASRSTPIILNGKLYTICRDKPGTPLEGEKVVCVNIETGDTIWENSFNVFLSDVPDTRVGWSAVAGDPKTGNIYALGVCGYFQCLDGNTGKTIWSHSLSEEYGLLSTYGGRTNFPIVHENLVIISAVVIGWGEMAKPAHRFIAFDTRNGQPVWFEGTRLLPEDTTYSAPVKTVINGQLMMIFGSGDGGFHAFQPRTGKNIWTYNVSARGINTTPLVVDGKVYAGHSEENIDSTQMGALFALDGSKSGDITKSGELWRNQGMFVGKSAPLMVDGTLWAIEDNASLLIVNPETGEQIARQKLGTMQRSSPIYADGKVYNCTANGRWYIMKPTRDEAGKVTGVDIVHKLRLNEEESHGSIIVSRGRIFLPTTGALYCIGNPEAGEPQSDPVPPMPEETKKSEDMKPAHVQIAPVESLLYPDQSQVFQARLFNANGQYVGLAKTGDVKFALAGPGTIDDNGKYVSPKSADLAAPAVARITATVGELSGKARIRIAPKLDWSFTFDDAVVPESWVGARYRHIGIDYDLYKSLTEKNAAAGQLYIYLTTDWTNFNRGTSTFDNSTARQTWTDLLIFMDLNSAEKTPKNLDEAKKVFDPLLEELKAVQVVKDWNWDTWSKDNADGSKQSGPKLTVNKGDRKEIGNGVMLKIKTIPKGARSQGWMGHTDFSNYTIEADVMGAEKDGKLPDMGLIGQRYTIDLMGANQELQIRTWPPQLRMAKSVPFAWKADVWYRLKMQASVENGKAVLRGKVWERDKEEPADWMLEATDESPNVIGSPGLFGNAKDAEIFYDNIKVYNNK